MNDYEAFLRSKVKMAQPDGVSICASEINPALKEHQRLMVQWMVEGGRRACFAAFGLGKSIIQLETLRLVLATVGGRGLIVCPLGVRQEFVRDAQEVLGWQMPPKFIRKIEEAGETGIYLTNYETVRDGKLDPRAFTAASLDEASILRGFGGSKTFREFMRLFTGDEGPKCDGAARKGVGTVPYRFVATATPSPNEYIELLAYADFLGIMDISQAKTRFFKRDSTKADKLTLHPHKEQEFWLWVASWALFVQRPSDLGCSDEGYDLPPLDVRWHEVATDHRGAGHDKSGQGKMFRDSAIGVQDAASEKRHSLPARIAKMLEIRADDPGAHRILWHDLESEREAIEAAVPSRAYGQWYEYRDGHEEGLALYERHYSAHVYADGRERKLFCGPGEKLVLLTERLDALFVWRKFIDASGQTGVNCAVFRNEGKLRSSALIKEAMAIAWRRWPRERLYTYVDAAAVRSKEPGKCFVKSGWTLCGETKGGLLIFEAYPRASIGPIEPRQVLRSVYGSQDLEPREESIAAFSAGVYQELATKPVLCGSGCNFQRHCAWAIYLGIGFKFNDFIQSIHRLQRFLQTRPVRIDIIYTEAEREVRKQLERKWQQHNQMVAKMTEIIRKFGLNQQAMAQVLTRKMGVERVEASGENWRMVNWDSVLETRRMEANSVGLILTSIPFSSQYEYSPNYADFGHSEGNKEFFEQMDFLTPELLRVLQPGRVCAVHVKDRIVPGGMTGLGYQTVYPFHARSIDHYCRHGFGYLGMKTIVTDVVRENNQTYRLGWTEQCKDGSKMGVGMPEYLLLFRKTPTGTENSYADVPVRKSKDRYTRSRWQTDAHGFSRSAGDRLLDPKEVQALAHDQIFKLFREHSLETVYDFEQHVRIGEALEAQGKLPSDFMLLQPQSWSDEVWTDITRMLTLNGAQHAKGREMHVCLARGSMVLTRAGYRPIQDVKVGDLVLTHKGRWRRVLVAKSTGTQPVVKLNAQGVSLTLTPDHRLWTRLVEATPWAMAHSRKAAEKKEPQWVEAKETRGSYLNLQLPPEEQPDITDATYWWLVGRWLADGHIDARGTAIISCGKHKAEHFEKMAGRFAPNLPHDTDTALQYGLKDKEFLLRRTLYLCGKGAANKHLPPQAFTLPKEQAVALLAGYLSGDGSFNESRQRWSASSVSRELILGIALLAQRVYGSIAGIHEGHAPGQQIIEGRTVNALQEWCLSFDVPSSNRKKGLPFILADGAWKKVRSIAPAGEVETWCLRVEEDESFTAEGCVVKNCPMQFDLADRVIAQMSNPGEVVFDPFAGLGTVPLRGMMQGRIGWGCELSPGYWADACAYLKAKEEELSMPTLFDLVALEGAA